MTATSGFTSRSATASCSPIAKVNWLYTSEPEPELNNRQIIQPRGKVLGGSSSINGLLYIRGQPEDFDHWRQLGKCRLELRGRAALFPARRGPGARRGRAARGRRAARGVQCLRTASAVRGFHRGRAAGGLSAQRRFQRTDPGRRRLFPAHRAQRAALLDRGRLSAPGAPPAQSRRRLECAGEPHLFSGRRADRRRIPARRGDAHRSCRRRGHRRRRRIQLAAAPAALGARAGARCCARSASTWSPTCRASAPTCRTIFRSACNIAAPSRSR